MNQGSRGELSINVYVLFLSVSEKGASRVGSRASARKKEFLNSKRILSGWKQFICLASSSLR